MSRHPVHISVNFVISLVITLIVAMESITATQNNVSDWINVAPSRFITYATYGAPLAAMFFYYVFDVFNEIYWAKKGAKGVPNLEWYIRLIVQLLLALVWYKLEHDSKDMFLYLQILFYVALLIWDAIVIWIGKQKELAFVIGHDIAGLIIVGGYASLLFGMHNGRLDSHDITWVFLLGIVTTLMIGNVLFLSARVVLVGMKIGGRSFFMEVLPPIWGSKQAIDDTSQTGAS